MSDLANLPTVPTVHCPQCDRSVRITELYAFGGRDRLRSTLTCGHVVATR